MSLDRTCKRSSWTKEENKAFENALADYSGDRDLIQQIAAAVPGKSLEEVIEHYLVLVEDIKDIESGIVPLPKYRRMQSSTERRKGIPWTAEEHRLFLQGLAKYGKGDWRAISRNFVLSRTPTQVASHAQKFYTRLNDKNNPKKRRSIHDVTSAANITEPSQGPCGGRLQWPITNYVTDAFNTGMLSIPEPVTTRISTDAIEGASAADLEKIPLGAAVGNELNSSFPGMVEFVQSIEGHIIVPAEVPSGVCHGVDTKTSPSHSLQPSIAVGSGMYIPSFNNVRYDLTALMSKQLFGSSQVGPTVNSASLPLPTIDRIGVQDCIASPSIPGSSSGGTYPCWNPSNIDDNTFDLVNLFPDGLGK
ncbi:Transcription factor MYB1R1 [Capsicum chinense]|nr:Transcription factor MYB1R1 [Capsicum chinense]